MLNKITWGVIFILMLYTAFFGGRLYEAHKYLEARKAEEQARLQQRMKYHGAPYAYEEKGRWYFKDTKGRRCRL